MHHFFDPLSELFVGHTFHRRIAHLHQHFVDGLTWDGDPGLLVVGSRFLDLFRGGRGHGGAAMLAGGPHHEGDAPHDADCHKGT